MSQQGGPVQHQGTQGGYRGGGWRGGRGFRGGRWRGRGGVYNQYGRRRGGKCNSRKKAVQVQTLEGQRGHVQPVW